MRVQRLFRDIASAWQTPSASTSSSLHVPSLSLSFFHRFVLLAAVHTPRKSRKSWSVICILPSIDGNRRRPTTAFSFCLPSKASNAYTEALYTGSSRVGIEIYFFPWSNPIYNCFSKAVIPKDSIWRDAAKPCQSWNLFNFFSLSFPRLGWVRLG